MNQNPGTIGKKVGMTQIFTGNGEVVRCTVIDANCTVVGKRTQDKDGYDALILGIGERREKLVNKPLGGAYKKSGVSPKKVLKELRVTAEEAGKYEVGQKLPLGDIFQDGQFVDAKGTSKGRGFAGVVKRWGMAGQVSTHGTHEYFRHGGSIGTNMTPGRTLPNVKMPGQYGNKTISNLNLKIAKVMADEGLLLIEGSVPGSKNGTVTIRGAIKKKNGGKKA